MILLVDNYDSFTYNLAHLFGELGAEVVVRRNDAIDADEAEQLAPSHLVVSPGPGRPSEAGASVEIVRRLAPHMPTLGVCLGHQAIVEAFGGEIGPAQKLVHGKASFISHDGRGLFEGLPEDFLAGRYHSLAATRIPDELEVSATCTDGEVMAVRHRELPTELVYEGNPTDPRTLELMRSYAASDWHVFWKLRMPASMPYLFTALKIAATASIVGALVGEGPGGIPNGLGRASINFNNQYVSGPEKLWAAIVATAVLGIVFFSLVRLTESAVLRGRPALSDG